MKKTKKNQRVNRLGLMAYKSVSYLFIGVLLFLVSCGDSSTTGPVITSENFEITTLKEKQVEKDYTPFIYGKIEPKEENITANYKIIDNSSLNGKVSVDPENGEILVDTGLDVGAYPFQLEVTGTGDYTGSFIIERTFYLTRPITKDDFTTKTSFTTNVGRTININPITLKDGITATYAVTNENMTINETTGEITINPGLNAEKHQFYMDVIGEGAYTGTETVGWELGLEKRQIEESDFEVEAVAGAFLRGYYGKVVFKNAVTANLDIYEIKDDNGSDIDTDKITIDPNGEIKIKGNLSPGDYTFAISVNGTGDYSDISYVIVYLDMGFTIASTLQLDNFRNFDYSRSGADNKNGEDEQLRHHLSVNIAEVNNNKYLLVGGRASRDGNFGGLRTYSLDADTSGLDDNYVSKIASRDLVITSPVTTAKMTDEGGNDVNYVFVSSNEDKIIVYRISSGGVLKEINYTVFQDKALDGPKNSSVVVIDGVTYLLVVGSISGTLNLLEIKNTGELELIDNASTSSNPSGITTAEVAGTTYVFVASNGALDIYKLDKLLDGLKLVSVDTILDSADANFELSGSFNNDITSAEIGGETYVFFAGHTDNGLSVFQVGNDGTLNNVDNVDKNDDSMLLGGVRDVETAKIGDATYLFAASHDDSAVIVFEVVDGGKLRNVAIVKDDATLKLENTLEIVTTEIGGKVYLFGTGFYNGTDSLDQGFTGMSAFEVKLLP